MKRKFPEYAYAAGLGAATIVAAVVLGLLIRSQLAASGRAVKEVAGNKETLAAYEQKVEDLRALKRNYQALVDKDPQALAELVEAIPKKPDSDRLAVALDALYAEFGKRFPGFRDLTTTEQSAENGLVSEFTVEVRDLSYAEAIQFLSRLEHNSRFIDTTALTVEGGGLVTVRVKAKVYIKP